MNATAAVICLTCFNIVFIPPTCVIGIDSVVMTLLLVESASLLWRPFHHDNEPRPKTPVAYRYTAAGIATGAEVRRVP